MSLPIPPLRSTAILLIGSCLTLSACASNSDRRGPPDGGERGERGERGQRQARNSGTFLQPAAVLFAGMDSNNDKVISREEMLTGTKAEWDGFGSNPSATKFAEWSVKTLGSRDSNPTFMSFDRDFNQVITETEFSSQMERLFTRYDTNKDGRLERSEMIVAFEAPRGREQIGGGGRGGRGQGGGRGGRGQGGGGGGGRGR